MTSIHHCGVDDASEGELAVYALQHLTKRLWTILESAKQREALAAYFMASSDE